MSETTICRQCSAENPVGSKYCNNCGTVLPPGTKIICPECQTPNPRNRLYCDNCGTKLVKEPPPAKKEPPPEEPPAVKRFDLPSRAPGDTNELDPTAVPDWLRTGEHSLDATMRQSESDDDDLPEPLPESKPLERSTGELPDWLLEDDEDAEDLFGTPKEITTEHYMELLHGPIGDEADETADSATEDEQDNDWQTDSDSSWLDELGPAQTGIFPETDERGRPLDPTTGLPDLPDWLTDIGPAHTGDLGRSAADKGSDWLDDFEPAYSGPLQEPETPFDLDEFGFTGQLDDQALEADELPDWLRNLRAETADDAVDSEALADDQSLADDEEPTDAALFDIDTETADSLTTVKELNDLFEDIEDDAYEVAPDWLLESLESDHEPIKTVPTEEIIASLADEGPTAFAETDFPTDVLDEDEEAFNIDAFLFDDQPVPQAEETPSDVDDLFTTPPDGDEEEADERPSLAEEAALFDDRDAPDELISEAPDWLSEIESTPPESLESEETAESDTTRTVDDEPASADLWDDLDQTDLLLEPDQLLADLEEADTVPGDFALDPLALDDLDEGDEIPEWISQLGPPAGDTGPLDADDDLADLARNEDLPEWITNMMPAGDQEGITLSGLSLVDDDDDYADPLDGIPEELASADLPDWLHDAPAGRAINLGADKTDALPSDIPAWLQQTGDDEETAQLSAELSDLLGPPVHETIPQLRQAEIPEWLQALKPAELTGEEPDGYTATSGPLSGIRGALEIEPLIARPRTATPTFLPFTVSKEQEQQVALLQQVIATETDSQAAPGVQPMVSMTPAVRAGLALLLLLAILLGLWGPALFAATPAPAPAAAALHTAVDAAAGQPVLMVFDYTPALAGELDPQAEMLLQQLAANGSPVVSLSQYTAGERLADLHTAVTHADNRTHIGYLPGQAIGVRQLGYCLAATPTCDGLIGPSLTATDRQTLADVTLVIILTGERDNLVNWVEQLAVYDGLTLTAAVTQGLRPVAAPYAASGQLSGLVAGVSEAAGYQQLLQAPPADALLRQQNAQAMAQLMAALILLFGLFAYARRTRR
jgi:hypothetical protein